MSILKPSVGPMPLLFEGSKADQTLYTLFDSGANLSCMSDNYAAELTELIAFKHPRRVATASEHHFIEITHSIRIDFYLNDVLLSDEFLVIPGLSEQAIIGAATMQKFGPPMRANQTGTVRRRGLNMTK